MTDFVRVSPAAALLPGQSRAVTVGRYEVALFNVAGDVYALENACPHQGGPLADGFLEGELVTCPWHAWCFDVRTGKMTLGDFANVPRFEVRIENGSIMVATEPQSEDA